jgi:predicted ATPase/class 3 adenylate cyclase/DNA-binding CsgD family transcriptional regulator
VVDRTGILTFVLTDIEGSTRLAQRIGEERFASLIDTHRALITEAFASHGGRVQLRADEALGVFERACDAVAAALETQRRMSSYPWPSGEAIKVRVGIHAGQASQDDEGEYTGMTLHRAARIRSAGHGGQVVMSRAVQDLLVDLPAGCSLLGLGEHALTDIDAPEHLSQLVHADIAVTFPPLRSVGPVGSRVPEQLTSLVGREEELTRLVELLHRPEVRIVTVTGPGGVGKTRLAVAAASAAAPEFASGVVFVNLAAIWDPRLVISAVASAVGLREAGRGELGGLADWLGPRETLIVLDNFEQVIDAAPLVTDLVRGGPGVKVLVTSRGLLRLSGEHGFPVAPLPVAAERPSTDGPEPHAASLGAGPAVALFVERARASRPDLDLGRDVEAVAALCRRLDGLPLAIELAAASVRVLSPSAMLERLDDGKRMLAPPNRDTPERHSSLTRAIGWSYDLLPPDQQRLFRRLAVFAGGCSVDAAESVVDAGDAFLDLLDGLVSQSLVIIETSGQSVRLTMLETIAACGREWLAASGEEAELRSIHAGIYAARAAAARDELRSAGREQALAELERDHANLRAALAHLRATDRDGFAAMAAALARFWQELGHLEEGRRWLTDALDIVAGGPPVLEMSVVLGAALLAFEDERINEATQLATAALHLAEDVGDDRRVVEATELLAAVDRFHGEHRSAADQYARATALARRLGDEWLIAHLFERGGLAAWAAGDYTRAAADLAASLQSFRRLGDEQGTAFALWELGSVDTQEGRVHLGTSRMEEAVPLLRRGRHRRQLARALYNLALAYLDDGDTARAEAALTEATSTFRAVKMSRHLSVMLPAFAAVAIARGSYERSARLLGATEPAWDAFRWSPPAVVLALWERCANDARRQLGAARFDALFADGRSFTLEEAVAEALTPIGGGNAGLTAREVEVLQLVAEGLSNAEIATRLFVSVRTVHAHLRSIYAKLNVGSRTGAVRSASEHGIVSLASTA